MIAGAWPHCAQPGTHRHDHRPDLTAGKCDRRIRPRPTLPQCRGSNFSSQGFRIDHPDPELGEQLMANALGVADREAMDGILRQLVKASVSGAGPDEVNLAFMISMVKSIQPADAVEAMLVAADGVGACDGDALRPSPRECRKTSPSTTAPRAPWAGSPAPFPPRSRRSTATAARYTSWRARHHRAERVGRATAARPSSATSPSMRT